MCSNAEKPSLDSLIEAAEKERNNQADGDTKTKEAAKTTEERI